MPPIMPSKDPVVLAEVKRLLDTATTLNTQGHTREARALMRLAVEQAPWLQQQQPPPVPQAKQQQAPTQPDVSTSAVQPGMIDTIVKELNALKAELSGLPPEIATNLNQFLMQTQNGLKGLAKAMQSAPKKPAAPPPVPQKQPAQPARPQAPKQPAVV